MSNLKIEHVIGGYVIPFYGNVKDEEFYKQETLNVIVKTKMFELLCRERNNSDKGCVNCPAFDLCNGIND